MKKRTILVFLIIIVILITSSCSLGLAQPSTNGDNYPATIAALQAEATILSLKSTISVQELASTQVIVVEATPLTVVQKEQSPNPTIQPSEVPEQPLIAAEEFDSWVQKAKILLFEDMVGDPKVRRYIKETLNRMELSYDDIGSAKGWLKERLLFGPEGGGTWDLIIIAVERRSGVSGEFFDYMSTALDNGSSIILEAFHLDKISQGKVKPILDKCGVTVENYIGQTHGSMDLLVWPLIDHPILTQPNNYLNFSKTRYFWPPDDLGDLMDLTGEGDAQLLLGRDTTQPTKHGVLAVCMGGQLIIQTYSTHDYEMDTAMNAWENYIYNALQNRYMGSQ